jgi:hypothetical protein
LTTTEIIETSFASLLFAATFLWGGRVRPFRRLIRDQHIIISYSAGMAVAYVFVHVMPELQRVRRAFATSVSTPLRYEGMAIYLVALLGFLVFYGIHQLHARLPRQTAGDQSAERVFGFHVGAFAAYVWLMAYLLVHNLEDTPVSIALYGFAIAFHFLTVDYALRREYGSAYQRIGRYVLAAMTVMGWTAGMLFALPQYVIAPSVAFVAGAIIMNSMIVELPAEQGVDSCRS